MTERCTLRRAARLLGTFGALALVLGTSPALMGCPPCVNTTEKLEDFEDGCGDVPCGWTADVGSIQRVTTFHEGEHGMRLGPSTTARRSTGFTSTLPPAQIDIVARCDDDTLLRVTLDGTDRFATDGGGPTDVSASIDPPGISGKRLFETYSTSFSWPGTATVTGLTVETRGPGSCVIDDIVVTSITAC